MPKETDITTRRLLPADMQAAAIVHRTAFNDRLPWLAGLHTPDEDFGFWSQVVFADCEIWGVDNGTGLLGVIAFCKDWIDQLYVLPSAQGKGVGTALLDIAKAAQPKLSLWTFQKNAGARRFYERHGFVPVEDTDGSGNEEREPDMLYRWEASRQRL
jgi:GNAT superfamily N-acetyltransferase